MSYWATAVLIVTFVAISIPMVLGFVHHRRNLQEPLFPTYRKELDQQISELHAQVLETHGVSVPTDTELPDYGVTGLDEWSLSRAI